MFTSPLGAPASFAAVEFSPNANRVISWGLEALLPKLTGFSPGVGNRLPEGFDVGDLRARLQEPSFESVATLEDAGIASGDASS